MPGMSPPWTNNLWWQQLENSPRPLGCIGKSHMPTALATGESGLSFPREHSPGAAPSGAHLGTRKDKLKVTWA